ncbi:hypothetical protein, partial [Candidatus Magnetobacterium casense]|uniref:hypothetical protein n=1 Tax=Candidatus Magnetobacterium casense TaxID=1455061 RepID=UPI001C43E7B6
FAGMTVTGFFQVCHSWLDQESKNCKSIVTMKYKEDTLLLIHIQILELRKVNYGLKEHSA